LDAPGDGALAWDDDDAAAHASDSLSRRAKAEKLAAEATTLSPWMIAEQRTRGNRRGAQKRPAKPARVLTLPLESVWAVEAVRAVDVHKEGDVDEFGLAIPTQWQRHLAVSFAPGTLRLDDAVLPCNDAASAVLFVRADDTWTALGAEQEDENFGVVGKPELLRTDYDVTLQQLLDSSPTHGACVAAVAAVAGGALLTRTLCACVCSQGAGVAAQYSHAATARVPEHAEDREAVVGCR